MKVHEIKKMQKNSNCNFWGCVSTDNRGAKFQASKLQHSENLQTLNRRTGRCEPRRHPPNHATNTMIFDDLR